MVAVLFAAVGNVEATVGRLDLSDSQGALVVRPTDVKGLAGHARAALNSASGQESVGGWDPVELAALRDKGLVLMVAMLGAVGGHVAASVGRHHLARDDATVVDGTTDVDGLSAVFSARHGVVGSWWSPDRRRLARM